MTEKITITISKETHAKLKAEAKRRNITIKKLGEEYFNLLIAKIQAEEESLINTL
jgi:hypothetical protein